MCRLPAIGNDSASVFDESVNGSNVVRAVKHDNRPATKQFHSRRPDDIEQSGGHCLISD